ncbi:MAG: MotA/TolQ/ExbB proton channel family protein [Methylovulum sp.]|uniref:MotA/TolQ/ExbB proton channel family protein n=1 Tax=Methylovulum sp. TaxID=1916980 RepID=UPI00260BDBEF|nr:MotA/TolQ/ExbB proton channel family protein [Methylovulum sp.]MDD2724958.1 MotA/TolQ/ExbB proton channel family protein [Methylovulum sp.]MDD5123518.1 MotA/TolQ/ExbB proton channel family protein [Methylovulum sp.]
MINISSANIVQLTLWILIGFSIITWTIIFLKSWMIWTINRSNRAYAQQFWNAGNLMAAAKLDYHNSALGRIAGAGFHALSDVHNNVSSTLELSGDIQLVLERSLRQQISKERKTLEQWLSILASIGSTSPFVGLFGTVWGIMHALQSISQAKSASLDVVAGPIGEALITTAIGIAAAIPAVLAYNFFIRTIKLSEAELEYFATDFLNLAVKAGLKTTQENNYGV